MAEAIRVGLVGIGRAGWGMHCGELSNFPEKFKIVAACDPESDRCDKMKEKYDCKTYATIEELLKDADVELVSIASRSPEHTPHALLALEAGKYVFLEKPIAIKYEDALKLKDADQKYPGKLFFRHNRRFEAGFAHIREIIASGILGDIYEIKLRRGGYQRRADWQTIIDCGGGQLNNWGPHLIDHGLQFLESPLKDLWSDLKLVAAAGDAEDHLKIVMRGENGRVVDIEISGGAVIKEPAYIVSGTRGGLSCDDNDITLKYLDPDQKLEKITAESKSPSLTASFGNDEKLKWRRTTIMVEPASKTDTHMIWSHLYAAIREKVPFPIKTDEAVEVVRVTDMVKKGTQFEMK